MSAKASASPPFKLYGFFAETFVHVGTGAAVDAVDLPIMREAGTGFPVIPGSSAKGALRDVATRRWGDSTIEPPRGALPDDAAERYKKWKGGADADRTPKLFGKAGSGLDGEAGQLIVSDLRLVLLPLASLDASFRWVTSPLLLARLGRDMQRAGIKAAFGEVSVSAGTAIAKAAATHDSRDQPSDLVYVQDHSFRRAQSESLNEIVAALKKLLPSSARAFLYDRLVILNEDDFAWFCRQAIPVRARNRLDLDSKTVVDGALWYEEALPPETVMSGLIGLRTPDDASLQKWRDELFQTPTTGGETVQTGDAMLQIGGNETVGMGWFSVQEINAHREVK